MEIPNSIKYATGAVALIAALSGGLWALDDRYATEQGVAKSLSMFDQKIEQDFKKVDIRILNIRYEQATESYYNLRKLVRENPRDVELQEDLSIVTEQRAELKKEIDEVLK